MTRPLPDDPETSDRLLDQLRDVARRLDPVPPEVTAAARASLAWRTIDAELAALTYDSVLEEPVLAGVRGASALRSLVFEAGALVVEVEVSGGGDDLRLLGQVAPAGPGVVEVHQPGVRRELEADALGRFSVGGLRSGPLRLRCRPEGAQEVVTDWVTL